MTTPSPRGITENDVWQAADAILLEGARPTIERVRVKIGRGSPNTVTPYLETWFRTLGARITDPMAFSAPPALPDPISEAAKHFWESALAAARAEGAAALEADRADLATVSRNLDAERAEFRADLTRINSQLQAKEEAALLLRAHLSESQGRVETLSAELLAKDQTIVDLRSRETESHADRAALRRQVDAERAGFEVVRKDFEACETAHQQRWALEVDRARETAKIAQSRLTQIEKEFLSQLEIRTRTLAESDDERRRIAELQARTESDLNSVRLALDAEINMHTMERNRVQEREFELSARNERLEQQLSAILEQLMVKETEHASLVRTLLERQNSANEASAVRPKRKRGVRHE